MSTKLPADATLNSVLQSAVRENWNRMALTDIGGVSLSYRDAAELIEKVHIMFEVAGVKKGDRVAICGRNSAHWAVVFIACLTSGVVAVPILHEFKSDTVQHLVNHSGARLLFVDPSIWENLDEAGMPNLLAALYIAEFGMPFCRAERLREVRENINEEFGRRFPTDFTPANIVYTPENPEDLAIINYTSGSTGMSKGVMLPYRSILNNVRFCLEHVDFLKAGDGMVNMLPLAHLYGMVIEMLHPFCRGCHCHFLTRLPSPKVILSAMAQVRPKLVITVPLVLEKIVKSRVFPKLRKPMMRILVRIPIVGNRILGKVRTALVQAFGGQLRELIIGGAPLNDEVAAFLDKIRFPYTVGYGMTECGPLITYAPPQDNPPMCCGKAVAGMEIKIDSPDPARVPGNIIVHGPNVMQGYLDNPEATREVLSADGWMNTGDMGIMLPGGYIRIMGRSKTMILGPSGQNIYPEEIEHKLNNLPYVAESLVIDDGGDLVALLHPDFDAAAAAGIDSSKLDALFAQSIAGVNKELPGYSRLKRHEIMTEEFEKTPKRSIKRFLYQR